MQRQAQQIEQAYRMLSQLQDQVARLLQASRLDAENSTLVAGLLTERDTQAKEIKDLRKRIWTLEGESAALKQEVSRLKQWQELTHVRADSAYKLADKVDEAVAGMREGAQGPKLVKRRAV